MRIGNGKDTHLLRSHPQRQAACILLDQVSQCSLEAAEAGSVNDIRILLLTVLVDVFHTELLGKKHVDLDSNKSVFFSEYILILNVEFRTIERRLINTDRVFQTQVIQDLLHGCLCLFPLFLCSFVLILRICRIPLGETESTVFEKTYSTEEILSQLQTVGEFLFQLIRTEDVVPLGDGELTDTDQTVHLTTILITEQS